MKLVRKAPGLVFGLLAGLGNLIVFLILYNKGTEAFLGSGRYIGWSIMLALGVFAALVEFNSNNRVIRFPRALGIILSVFLIAELFAVATEYFIYRYDQQLPEKVAVVKLAETEKWMDRFGSAIDYSKSDREEILTQVKVANYRFTTGNAALKLFTVLCIDFLFALLLAGILRKEPKSGNEST